MLVWGDVIFKDRRSAHLEGEFVVFLIGMRINRPWKIHQWLPVARAMPRMIQELRAQPDSGLLGYEMWFGRTTLMLQDKMPGRIATGSA